MPMATEADKRRDLVVSREPVGPVKKSGAPTEGEQMLSDAVKIVIICWIALILLAWSLKGHII